MSVKLLLSHPGITTKAVKDGDEYVVTGGKMWTTSGTQADWMCLLANTSDGPLHRNKSLICLPMSLPGRPRLPVGAARRKVSFSFCSLSQACTLPAGSINSG